MEKDSAGKGNWKKSLFEIIYESETFLGKFFNVALIGCIVLSVFIVMLDSVEEIHVRFGRVLFVLEWAVTILFSIEYMLRIFCVKKPLNYILSPMGGVDLIAILPAYLSLFFAGTQYLLVIRAFRILRVFRILKMWNFINASHMLIKALHTSAIKIGVFLLFVVVLVVILGSVMHLIEGGKHGYENIPKSIYWAIVTLTTVGYGDISPRTPLGRLFASVVMLFGYSILAVPTGIVTSELIKSAKAKHSGSGQNCSACGRGGHDEDAHYCKFCGGKL